MRIGYACIYLGPLPLAYRTCIQKYATAEKLRELIAHNLQTLGGMLDYNHMQGLRMLRISSEIIPFGSSPVNTLDWRQQFASELVALGEKAYRYDLRLSMHPGQYTVLNSPDAGVVERAVADLRYHCDFLDALGLDGQHKLILHVGGVYGDKQAALARFAANYRQLESRIQARLVIENDDKLYNLAEVLELGRELSIPVVFDNLHHQVNPSPEPLTEAQWLAACAETWRERDGRPKMHYSQQAAAKKPGSHSGSVAIAPFLAFVRQLPEKARPDIMLEVKDKNLSALKCWNCLRQRPNIRYLEEEWARYKYTVLEHSPAIYQQIRQLLKDKQAYPAEAFYALLEQALATEPSRGTAVNALQHVWGYVKDTATVAEKQRFARDLTAFEAGELPLSRLKRGLQRLTEKYGQPYLAQSYYFIL